MSLTFQHLFAKPTSLTTFHFTSIKNPNLAPPITSCHVCVPAYSRTLTSKLQKPRKSLNDFTLQAYLSDNDFVQDRRNPSGEFNFDDFLSFSEILCNLSSVVILISYVVICTVSISKRTALGLLGSNCVFAFGLVVMMGGVMIGSWIRRRQWRRICHETYMGGRDSVNLVERIEKLEEDLRSSTTIIRVLSKQLEKLGIRFRVTRKALKTPIAETAALAQKNFEATRALAVQEDILEKELGEIQKVLLAMQDQQQKQLELILAIGKTGKLFETKRESIQEQEMVRTSDLTKGVKEQEHQQTQESVAKGTNNDRL